MPDNFQITPERKASMDKVKELLAALRTNYLCDLPSHIDELEQLLLALERGGYQLEICRELYRRIHTLKGSGGTYGLHVLSDICHPFEDLLSNLIENPTLFSTVFGNKALRYIDLLRKVLVIYQAGQEPGADIASTLQTLRQDASYQGGSALIVESSDVVIRMLKDILTAHNFRVEVVSDGYLALGRLLAEPFALLITGLETRRLNGLALVSAVQQSGVRISKTKTVLLTTTKLKVNAAKPDFILRKDADLKKNFKNVVNDIHRK